MHWLVKVLFHPVVVVLMFVGLSIFWLLPSIHFIAMLDWRVYRLMNWSMVLNGLMFWSVVLDSHSLWSPGSRIAMMLVVVPPQILIGALIFFTPHDLYPIYSLCGRAFTGMSTVTDQQIGGLILWMHGAMMSVIGILIVIHKELRQAERVPGVTPPAKNSARIKPNYGFFCSALRNEDTWRVVTGDASLPQLLRMKLSTSAICRSEKVFAKLGIS